MPGRLPLPMRNVALAAFALVVLLATPLAVPPGAAQDGATLRISELLPAPEAAAGQREFIELHNPGPGAVDLAGWTLRDAPTAANNTNAFTFPPITLDAGRRVVVWSNGTPDGTGLAWSASASKAVWNDAGDAATLLDPQGTVRAWFAYGSVTQPAPSGFEAAKPAAPAKGKSLQWSDNAWTPAAPTPGFGLDESGGAVLVTVSNVPPTVHLEAPATVRPNQAVAVRLRIEDANGAPDVVAWTLRSGPVIVHVGNSSLDDTRVVTAPAALGNWTLDLHATDAAGANTSVQVRVLVQRPLVSVRMPAEGAVRFLELQPGQRNATSTQPFAIRNDGPVPTIPLLDISPLRSGRNAIPVDGNLWLGLDAGAGLDWVAYEGPLQALPELAPGSEMTVLLRIGQVPTPAAAGVYGTAFTVVPA